MSHTPVIDREIKNSRDLPMTSNYLSAKKSPKGSSTFKDRLENQRGSDTLSLVDLFIGDEGAYEVARFLKYNKDFLAVHLRGNNISAAGFESICQALRGSTRLKTLNAEWNNIGSDVSGLAALHQLLRSSSTIESIDLKNNRIGHNSTRVLADILRDSSLKKLDLRWNEIGEEGGQQILAVFKETRKKVAVDLNGNKLNEETLAQINEFAGADGTVSHRSGIGSRFEAVKTRQFSPPTREEMGSQEVITSNFQGRSEPQVHTSSVSKYQSNVGRNYESSYHKRESLKERNLWNDRNHNTSNNGLTINTQFPVGLESEKKGGNPGYSTTSHQRVEQTERVEGGSYDTGRQPYTTKANMENWKPSYDANVNSNNPEASDRGSYEVNKRSQNTLAGQLLKEKEGTPSGKYQTKRSTHESRGNTSQVEVKTDFVNNLLKRASANQDNNRESVASYENEAQNLRVGKLISELERALDKERTRANEAERKLGIVLNEFQVESALRQDSEKKYGQLIENLKRTDTELHGLKGEFSTVSHERDRYRDEVMMLREENERLEDYSKRKGAEIEERFRGQMRSLENQNYELRQDVEAVQRELNGQIVDNRREFEQKTRQYEDQIEEFSKLNDELSNELASQIEHIEKLKEEHERDLRRAVEKARDDEVSKAQIVIGELEGELHKVKASHESLTRKNSEMLKDLQGYERQIRDQHIQFGNELSRVGNEIERYRGEVEQANVMIQKQSQQISMKDGTISKLEGEVERLKAELQRLADIQVGQIENFKREYEIEKRRFEENERQLLGKIEDVERRLVESQNETIKVTREYDRLVEIMQGNVSRVIQDTFSTHKNTSEIRHIEHKITTPAKNYMDERPVNTGNYQSRLYQNERKYF